MAYPITNPQQAQFFILGFAIIIPIVSFALLIFCQKHKKRYVYLTLKIIIFSILHIKRYTRTIDYDRIMILKSPLNGF